MSIQPRERTEIKFIDKMILEQISDVGCMVGSCYFKESSFDVSVFNELNIFLPDQIRMSATKRQAEFLAGRYVVSAALSSMHLKASTIHIGFDRSPIWPSDVRGSISHSRDIAVCIVSYSSSRKYVGIDIEHYIEENLVDAIRGYVGKQSEFELFNNCLMTGSVVTTLIFSSKETLFKSIYPFIKVILDFHDSEVVGNDPVEKKIYISLIVDKKNLPVKSKIYTVNYEIFQTYVRTYISEND